MSIWLFAENEFNRDADEKNDFKFFVIDKKKLNKRNIKSGDYLVTYVTKIMKLTDIRIVTNNEPKILPEFIKYDRKFEYYLETKLYKKLNKENWIDRSIIIANTLRYNFISGIKTTLGTVTGSAFMFKY